MICNLLTPTSIFLNTLVLKFCNLLFYYFYRESNNIIRTIIITNNFTINLNTTILGTINGN